MAQFGVWCEVSGGVTGNRQAWLKGSEGERVTFPDAAAAEAEASKLNAQMNHAFSRASFRYSARELN